MTVMALREDPRRAPSTTTSSDRNLSWVDVCALEEIWPDSGVAALVNGKQIALVRVGDSAVVFAISNFDPFSDAFVIARGIVGDRAGRPKIASPIFKQNFDLETGACLDDPSVVLATYPVRVREGRVELAVDP
jgi:nitrite reductase (NADH) small subunit